MPGKNSIFSMILATLLLCAAGNSTKGKITLDFEGGIIRIGDKMLAYGILDQETNTLVVSGEDNYIRTYAVKADVVGVVVRAEKLDDLTVFELLRSDGTFVTVHYTTTGAASTSFTDPA